MRKAPSVCPTWPQAIAASLLWAIGGAAWAAEDVRFASVCVEPDMQCSSLTRIERLEEGWSIQSQAAMELGVETTSDFLIPLSQSRWDDATLTLYWSRPLADRARQELVPSNAADLPGQISQPLSSVLRYSFLASTVSDPVFGADLVVARNNTHFQTSGVVSGGVFTRGLSAIYHRQPDQARRWVAGEHLALSADPLGGATVISGLTLVRDFSLQPGFDYRAKPGVEGVIEQPGVIEVYNNGALVRTTPVQPGPYEWGATGVGSGAQQLQFVFRAADGSTRVLSRQGFYSQSNALAKGVSDYSVSLGQNRSGEIAWQVNYRQGLHPRLTVGVRAEGEDDHHNMGVSAQVSASTLAMDAAIARDDAGLSAWSAAITGGWGAYDFYASRRKFDEGYWRLGHDASIMLGPDVEVVLEDAVGASWSGNRSSLMVQHGNRHFSDGGLIRETRLQASFQQKNRWRWTLGASRQEGVFSDRVASISLSVPMGPRASSTVLAQQGTNPLVSLTMNRTPQERFGWSASAGFVNPLDDQPSVASLRLSNSTSVGTAGLDAFAIGSSANATLGWSGSIVAVDGDMTFSSAYPGGFAWVRAPSTPKATVLYNNRPMGEVGPRGRVVDNLPANTPVNIKLDPDTLPLQSHLSSSSIRFLSSGIGVASVEFSPLQDESMTLQVSGPKGPVSLGTLELSDGTRLLVGHTGQVWVQSRLPADPRATWHGDGGPLSCQVSADSGVSCTLPADTAP